MKPCSSSTRLESSAVLSRMHAVPLWWMTAQEDSCIITLTKNIDMDNNQLATTQPQTIQGLMNSTGIQNKLMGMFSNNKTLTERFASSVISIATGNPLLKRAEPLTIVGAAMQAAMMGLQVVPTLGQCYIIPYGNKAQFQIGYLGMLQLCQRSGQFRKILAAVVHDGEYVSGDEFDEDYVFDKSQRKSDQVIGYMAKFVLLNGFTKTAYWDIKRVQDHAQKYSQAYRNGYNSPWKSDFDAMAMKTVLKSILKYAPKSIEMQQAMIYDQAVVNVDLEKIDDDSSDIDIDIFAPEYVDNDRSAKDEKKSAAVDAAIKNQKKEAGK
jgi:recombination protein RecT